MLISFRIYVVDNKCPSDDEITLGLIRDGFYGRTRPEAWAEWIKLNGGTRQKWNKRGYVSRPVDVKAVFE